MPPLLNKVIRSLRQPKSIVSRLRAHRGVIRNVFATTHNQTALLSYLVAPFLVGASSSHTNQQEILGMARELVRMGFNVDVCDYTCTKRIDYSHYDLIIGFGYPLNNAFRRQCQCPTIYYGTGMHVCHQNTASLKRAKEVYAQKNIWIIESCRVVEQAWSEQTSLVDAIITLGTDVVADSYRKHFNGPVFLQPASYNAALSDNQLQGKNWEKAKNHFLWFGSAGAVHKGLDLLLTVFAQRPELNLHICSQLEKEPSFMQAFSKELAAPNITVHGFVDIHSPEFSRLVHQCAFTVLPSCSEGQATSVLNTACNGLIPVVTKHCGLDVKEYGISFTGLSVPDVIKAIDQCCTLDGEELQERSEMSRKDICTGHSLDAFQKAFRTNLELAFSIIQGEK